MNRFWLAFISVAIIFIVTSCGSSRKAVEDNVEYQEENSELSEQGNGAEYDMATVVESNADWHDVTLSGTMTVGTTSSLRSSVVVKMIKGESVSISIRPILGIEMGKLYFSGDTVTVVDKYHKVYMQESIGAFLGRHIDVATLQSLLLSRPFVMGYGELSEANAGRMDCGKCDDGGNWVLSPKKQDAMFAYNFDMKGNNISHFNVVIPSTGKSYALNFSRYITTVKGLVAGRIDAEILVSGIVVNFELLYGSSIKWDTGTTDSINIPANAGKLGFADVIKLLSGK